MARLLRLLPDPASTHEPGSVDPPKIAFISLAAVGERAQPLQRTAPSRRIGVQSSGCRRFANGVLAHVRTSGGPSGPAHPSLWFTRSPPTLRSVPCLARSNRRGTWPVCPVVWEGRRREVPPYPDLGRGAAVRLLRPERQLATHSGLSKAGRSASGGQEKTFQQPVKT